jgi:hypothetical protein
MGDAIAATLHAVGVNFGDHGETVLTAVEVGEGDTVRSLLEHVIPVGSAYRGRNYEHFVTLRFVMPKPDVAERPADGSTPVTEPF